MIKIYPITNLNYNVFSFEHTPAFFEKNNIAFTRNMNEADVFIARRMDADLFRLVDSWLLEKSIKPKPVLVYTHEPRFTKTSEHLLTGITTLPVHIMNMYTNNVYFSNFTVYGHKINRVVKPVNTVSFSTKPIAALATYVNEPEQEFILNGINIDLSVKRQRLMIDAFNQGLADIYGMNWPVGYTSTESRYNQRENSKNEILKKYQFNICMENTSFPYYCTEKIWESIKGYCLPVYSSFNTKIYETFPRGSFIDYDTFKDHDTLLGFIKNMNADEYIERLNLCISVSNSLYENMDYAAEEQRLLESIAEKIHQIAKSA